MNYPHNLRQQLTIYGLVISLLLQGCDKTTNLTICSGKRRVDPAELVGKHTSNKRARNEKLRPRVIPFQKETPSSKGSLRWVRVVSSGSGQEKLKKRNKKQKERDNYRVAHRKRIKSSEQEKKSKSQKVQSRCGVRPSGATHGRDITLRKAESKIKVEYEEPPLELDIPGTPKKQVRTKRQDKLKTINSAEEGNKSLGINSPGTSKKRIKKKSKHASVGEASRPNLLNLPAELLEEIMAYLSFKEVMVIRQLDHYLYEFITGYNQVGVFGISEQNKPARLVTNVSWPFKHAIDFGGLSCKHGPIPSFLFYQLMRIVKNLPDDYWPYLADSQIHTINFWRNKIEPKSLEMLGKYLQGSKINKISLWWNKMGDRGAEFLGRTLAEGNTGVREISLNDNELKAAGAKGLTKCLPNSVHILDLKGNEIGDIGAISVAENIQGKNELEEINLVRNKIGDEGLIGVLENLSSGALVKKLCTRSDVHQKFVRIA